MAIAIGLTFLFSFDFLFKCHQTILNEIIFIILESIKRSGIIEDLVHPLRKDKSEKNMMAMFILMDQAFSVSLYLVF